MSYDLVRRCHVLALVLRTVSHGLLRGDMDDGTNGGGCGGLLVAVLLPLLLHGARHEAGMETKGRTDAAPRTHGTKRSRMMIESRAIRERQIDFDLQDEGGFM